jgi:hypothetical protein
MQDQEFYTKTVEDSGQIRFLINEQYYGEKFTPIKKIFQHLTGREKSDLKFIHDMIYYKGGYPKEDSPPKMDAILDKFVTLVRYFQLLGKSDEINKKLLERGVKIEITDPMEDKQIVFSQRFQEMEEADQDELLDVWFKIFPGENINQLDIYTSELMKKLLELSLPLQAEICNASDSIKIINSAAVEERTGIKKKNFLEAVKLKYKEMVDDTKKEKALEKIKKDDIENLEEAISIF